MNLACKLLIPFGMIIFMAGAQAQSVHGVLRVVKGDVQVKSSKGEVTKARIGAKVFPKDIVITGKEARAKIVMVDNNEINISPESQIEIQNYEYDPAGGKKDVLLNVIYGKVRSKVEQKYDGKTTKFQIKTPSAVAGVRGTDFMMGFNQSNRTSQVVTFEGKVEFGMPGPGGTISNPVFVSPGMTAAINPGSPPSAPQPMPKEELKKMDKESATPESTKAQGPVSENKSENKSTDTAGKKEDSKTSEQPKAEASVPAKSGESRQPASETPKTACTMCGAPPAAPPPPPIVVAPTTPTAFNPNDFIKRDNLLVNDTIKGGNTNLIIKVRGQ